MQTYVPVPLNRVQPGRVLPVDLWTPDGRLLLRRGQSLQSDAHRDMLASHHAGMTQADALAWQRSLERLMRRMRANGASMSAIAQASMPEDILDTDYLEGHAIDGGWLDLQEILRGLLYQGAGATDPLARLQGLQDKALMLLRRDPDQALFVLLQALPDLPLGYCATHALLAGALAALGAEKLALPEHSAATLLRASMMMNIGMARPQDSLSRQRHPPDAQQRQIIAAHPPASADILRGFGLADDELLHLVHWHHNPERADLPEPALQRLHMLHLADTLVARMAPRASRAAMLPIGATKALLLQDSQASLDARQALAAVLGFYPPGSFVQLVNGEVAVVIKRGARAHTPHLASIMSASGMPLSTYVYHDSAYPRSPDHAIRAPVPAHSVNIRVSQDKVQRLRQQHGI